MIAPARQAAFDALRAHAERGTDLPTAVAAARHALVDPRDQALLTELVTGTLRMRRAVDYQLAARTARSLDSLDPSVLSTLRLGGFQLLYLDRLPPSAIVHDAVALARRGGTSSAAGLVNAVLRRLAHDRSRLTWPEPPEVSDIVALGTRHSHPDWLVERWLVRHGAEATRAWLAFNNEAPRLCLAVNRRKGSRDDLAARLADEGMTTQATTRAPYGLAVMDGVPMRTVAFNEGWFVVQDEASQLVAELGPVAPGQRVLDLCAAPGGKTMALVSRVAPTGRVVACDVRPRRVRLLASTLARLGLDDVPVVQVPASGALPFANGSFDVVFVDAPCSGLGTIRRDPDIRWSCRPEDLPRLAGQQRTLLHRAAPLVAAGGSLIYATCSSEPDENDDVVRAFLEEEPTFALMSEHRTSPPTDRLEAFYGAVIARNL